LRNFLFKKLFHWLFLFFTALLPLLVCAEDKLNPADPVPPEWIEKTLVDAEGRYENALKLFNPWYTGPLLAPSASMETPGHANMQPYLYLTGVQGIFNAQRKSISIPSKFSINPVPVVCQIGVTPSVDTTVVIGALGQWWRGRFSGGMQDIALKCGFLINQQTLYIPGVKFTVGQTFPVGKYKNLNPEKLGLDGTGNGTWSTTFTLTVAKLLFWNTLHPFNTRFAIGYSVDTPIKVTNFNVYGGGYGTRGTISPGNTLNMDLGLELSLNISWVIAMDIVYNCSDRTTFSGIPGTMTPGGTQPAWLGNGFSDQLSLAPAIEYSFSEKMGFLFGCWFTVYGRNATNFISGVFSWVLDLP